MVQPKKKLRKLSMNFNILITRLELINESHGHLIDKYLRKLLIVNETHKQNKCVSQ